MTPPVVAVCGAAAATAEQEGVAEEVGRLLARRGAVVVCGGLGGVMAAVARGVREAGGVCVGLLPGDDARAGARDLSVALATGLGEMRNSLIVRAALGVVAIGGGYGTLSEIALARRIGRPVALLGTWELRAPGGGEVDDADLHRAAAPADAVDWLAARAGIGAEPG